jgi:flagellar biosynthesis protein
MSRKGKSRGRAAALRYERGQDTAPSVIAKGQGLIADQILDIARRHSIPIHEDPALVELLSRLDVDEHIPPELYLVVAEVLAFIYRAHAAATPVPGSRGDSAS